MNKVIQIANLVGHKVARKNPNRGRVYYQGGIAPTIYNFAIGGGHGIFILDLYETTSQENDL